MYIETPNLVIDTPENKLAQPDEISYYELEKERKLFQDYDINADVMAMVRMIFRWNMEDKGVPRESRKPIWIYIESPGGNLTFMWTLIDSIMLSETPVYTVNVGYCASAAALIFMAGEKRLMMPRAKVLIHEGSASFGGDAGKVLDASDSYKKDLKAMKDFILERTSIPKTQLAKKRSNDWELDSAYCLENNVCTAVINSLKEIL